MNTISHFPLFIDPSLFSLNTKKPKENLIELFQSAVDSLDSKFTQRRSKKRFCLIKSRLKKISKALKISQQNITQLKGGEFAKIPFIGRLFKRFLKWYNQTSLHREKKKKGRLKKQKIRYEKEIKILQPSLFVFKRDKLNKIFEIENLMRVILEKDFPEKEKYENLYTQKILPLVQKAKKLIIKRPFHFAAKSAAEKGKALQAGLAALKKLTETRSFVESKHDAVRRVFLFPKEKIVFKQLTERAKEEEFLANHLFELMSKKAIVPTFQIERASTKKFGMSFSNKVQARGFSIGSLSPTAYDKIQTKLSPEHVLILNHHQKKSIQTNYVMSQHKKKAKQTWFIQFPQKSWKRISLKELQKLYLADRLPPSAMIKSIGEKSLSLHEHILKNTAFFKALVYLPTLHASPALYFLPDFTHATEKKAYERCEQFQWLYFDTLGNQQQVNFKTLQQHFLQEEKMNDIEPLFIEGIPIPDQEDLEKAMNVKWKVVTSTLMQIEDNNLIEFDNLNAKPFISNMILMKDLDSKARNALLDRLTPDSQFNAILTGEMQMLDLHHENLGISPKQNTHYKHFKKVKFSVFPFTAKKNLNELIIDYLTGQVTADTLIKFQQNKKTVRKALKDLPELKKALNVRWKLVIFDTDLSLSEDNRLQLEVYSDQKQHLIPLRSVLLETQWKDRPLDKEILKRLMNSKERDLKVKEWVAREDAPIYKRLSPACRKKIKQQLYPIIKKYSLSETRKQEETETLRGLQFQFIDELSAIHKPKTLKFWKNMEKELSSIVKKQDLTSLSSQAIKNRYRIAAQLFPRLTLRQQEALFKRQESRDDYLKNYRKVSHSSLSGIQLFNQIKEFIQETSTPLSSIRREELLKKLKDQKKSLLMNAEMLQNLKEEVAQECQPSYFNLMKAMYPLLADAYTLNQYVFENEETAGKYIGLYHQSLETIIHKAKTKFKIHSPEFNLAKQLENQIESIQDPSFFGYWQ